MNALVPNGGQAITMTSLEIVEFINDDRKAQAEAAGAEFPSKGFAKLEHDNFMAKVPKVLKKAAPKFLGTGFYLNGTGSQVERTIYVFPKREACLMAMSYSYDLQAKVYDRMTALEENVQGTGPAPAALTRMQILEIAMESEKARIVAESQRDEAVRTKALIGSKREATAMATASAKSREVEKLKEELGRNHEFATVTAVEKATKRKLPNNAYVDLRREAAANGIAAPEVPDQRYGTVRAWPAIAWKKVFDIELPSIFPSHFGGAH